MGVEVLHPQSVVYWTVVPGSGPSTQGLQGRSTVKPDGTIGLGKNAEYGSVHVAGLTTEQARTAIMKQVARHIKEPRVNVSLAPPGQPVETVAHSQVARSGAAVVRTSHTSGPSLTDTGAPAENRIVTASGTTPDDPISTIEPPPASPELPFPGHPPMEAPGPHFGGPGGAPNEMNMIPLAPYLIGVTDILLIEYEPTKELPGRQPIRGQHLVNPDGTVHIGVYGTVRVAGLTLEAARQAIGEVIRTSPSGDKQFDIRKLNVDILAYNSKKYYVVTDGGGYGEQVYPFPVTGNETVLDALSLIGGLPPVSSKTHIWVARRGLGGGYGAILPVDWIGITQRAAWTTNYQLLPGDRIYVKADHWRTFDSGVQKVLSPFERILGATLLGASTVQEIRLRQGGGTSGIGGR
jgi:polysaccharide export outer membrane protein